ncbi:MAG: alpha/beta hydrolase [Burkholderiaceae bacterium]
MRLRSAILPAAALLAAAAVAYSQRSPKPNPSMQKVLDALASLGPKPIETLTPEEARQQPTPADAVKKVLQQEGRSADTGGVEVRHMTIPGPAGDIPIHVYTPQGDGPFPVMVYFHGGGFVIADTAVYDASPRALARGANAIMVAVDYHRAPEHKFPAAPNDAFAAYRWVCEHAQEINGDPQCVAVGGESAGGNLATVVSMMARDRDAPLPVHQLLVYPVAGDDMNTPSYRENAQAKPLNKAMMEWFFKYYLGSPEDADNPYAVPLKAQSLAGLPPATVITDEIDPLRSEGKQYAERLQQDGVPVAYRNYDGVTHEFFGMGAVLPEAQDAERFAAEELKKAFAAAHRRHEASTRAAAPAATPVTAGEGDDAS